MYLSITLMLHSDCSGWHFSWFNCLSVPLILTISWDHLSSVGIWIPPQFECNGMGWRSFIFLNTLEITDCSDFVVDKFERPVKICQVNFGLTRTLSTYANRILGNICLDLVTPLTFKGYLYNKPFPFLFLSVVPNGII